MTRSTYAYDQLDRVRMFRAATDGPADLRAFLGRLRDRLAYYRWGPVK